MNKLTKINNKNWLATDKDDEYLALRIYKLIKSTSIPTLNGIVNRPTLETILYFASVSDLYNVSLEVKDDSNLLAQTLYRLTITSDNEIINNKVVYCSQQFIHMLFVERSSLLDGVRIDRPSLAVCELLSNAIEDAVVKLVKTNGVIN